METGHGAFAVLVLLASTAQAEDIAGGFIHDGGYRTYVLHVPSGYVEEAVDSLALVFALHSGGGSAQTIMDGSDLSIKADAEGFFVCYPNAAQGFWNSGIFQIPYDDVGFISVLIDTLASSYPIDTRRVYAAGFSNGGSMTHRLACELSSKIAAAAPVAGMLEIDPGQCQVQRSISIIAFHARDDDAMPYNDGESSVEGWAERLGCDIGPDTFYSDSAALRQTWKRADQSSDVVFWTTSDGGHSWPGGNPYIDIPSDDISANDLMWDFFTDHPMPAQEPGISEASQYTAFEVGGIISGTVPVRFLLDQACPVTIVLYDVTGSKKTQLLNERLEGGQHELKLDVSDLASGVYFCRFRTPQVYKTLPFGLIK